MSAREPAARNAALVDRYGPWALVTGAARGIGAEFALQLAQAGFDLALLDQDPAGLHETAAAVQALGRQALGIAADLRREDFIGQVERELAGRDIGLVVSNAAVMSLGLFLSRPVEDHLQVVEVNVRAPLILARHFAPRLQARGRGGLLFMSSLSGLHGTPYLANYAATKAWNLILAEGLWEELRPYGVDVLAFLASGTRTPGFVDSGPQLHRAPRMPVMEPQQVVREALAALGQGPCAIAGRGNRLIFPLLSRLLPRKTMIAFTARTMRALYER